MLNRRKALIGYTVYTLGKPIAKRALRAKAKVPGMAGSASRLRFSTLVAAGGALIGGLAFWRRHRSKADAPSES